MRVTSCDIHYRLLVQFTYVIQFVVDIIVYTLFRQLLYNFIHNAILINIKLVYNCIRSMHTVFVTH